MSIKRLFDANVVLLASRALTTSLPVNQRNHPPTKPTYKRSPTEPSSHHHQPSYNRSHVAQGHASSFALVLILFIVVFIVAAHATLCDRRERVHDHDQHIWSLGYTAHVSVCCAHTHRASRAVYTVAWHSQKLALLSKMISMHILGRASISSSLAPTHDEYTNWNYGAEVVTSYEFVHLCGDRIRRIL